MQGSAILFRPFALSVVALLVLGGCGNAPVSTAPVSTSEVSAQAASRQQKTGVGSTFHVSMRQDSLAGGTYVDLTYQDARGYFAPGAMAGHDLYAYIQTTTRSGKVLENTKVRLTPGRGQRNFYTGSDIAKGLTAKDIRAVEVAFYMGKTWDSNLGKNYRVTF